MKRLLLLFFVLTNTLMAQEQLESSEAYLLSNNRIYQLSLDLQGYLRYVPRTDSLACERLGAFSYDEAKEQFLVVGLKSGVIYKVDLRGGIEQLGAIKNLPTSVGIERGAISEGRFYLYDTQNKLYFYVDLEGDKALEYTKAQTQSLEVNRVAAIPGSSELEVFDRRNVVYKHKNSQIKTGKGRRIHRLPKRKNYRDVLWRGRYLSLVATENNRKLNIFSPQLMGVDNFWDMKQFLPGDAAQSYRGQDFLWEQGNVMHFRAEKKSNMIDIHWSYFTQKGEEGTWTVEYSDDQITWTVLKTVHFQARQEQLHQFRAYDYTVNKPQRYYRLLRREKEIPVYHSRSVLVEKEENLEHLFISPQQLLQQDVLTLHSKGYQGRKLSIEIYNTLGDRVYESIYTASAAVRVEQLDLSHLLPGIYTFCVREGLKKRYFKFAKL